MKAGRWFAAVITGLMFIVTLGVVGLGFTVQASLMDRRVWVDTIMELTDLERLNSVLQEYAPGVLEGPAGGHATLPEELEMPLKEMGLPLDDLEPGLPGNGRNQNEIRPLFTREMFTVAQAFQTALAEYLEQAVTGYYEFLTGKSDVIDLGAVSYHKALEQAAGGLEKQVRAARSGEAAASELTTAAAHIPEQEFQEALRAVQELYTAGFTLLGSLSAEREGYVIIPTPRHFNDRQEFQKLVTYVNTVLIISTAIIVFLSALFFLLGQKESKTLWYMGNSFLCYAVLAGLFLGAGYFLYSQLVGEELLRYILTPGISEEITTRQVDLMLAVLNAYSGVLFRLVRPLIVFAASTLVIGYLIRAAGVIRARKARGI